MGGCVLLGPSSPAVHHFLALQLHLLQLAALLDLGEVSAQQTVHVLEFRDLFVAQAARANADAQAEGTQPILANIFVGIGVFQAAETVLPPADILIIYTRICYTYFCVTGEAIALPGHKPLRTSTLTGS